MKLLSKFPSTQFLQMNSVYFDLEYSSATLLEDYFPDLISFRGSKCDDDCVYHILAIFGQQLQALEVDNPFIHLPQDVCFESMEELSICCTPGTCSTMHIIRRSTKSLKRISFEWSECDEQLVIDLLSEQKELEELIVLIDYKDHQQVCAALERAVFNIRKIEKESIQIKVLLTDTDEIASASDFIFGLSRVVNALKSSKIEQFVLRYSLCHLGINDNLQSELRYFKQQNSSQFDAQFNDTEIAVANKGCTNRGSVLSYFFTGWLTD